MNLLLSIFMKDRTLTDNLKLQRRRIWLDLVRKLAWQALKYRCEWPSSTLHCRSFLEHQRSALFPRTCGPAWKKMTSLLWPAEFVFGYLIFDLWDSWLDFPRKRKLHSFSHLNFSYCEISHDFFFLQVNSHVGGRLWSHTGLLYLAVVSPFLMCFVTHAWCLSRFRWNHVYYVPCPFK